MVDTPCMLRTVLDNDREDLQCALTECFGDGVNKYNEHKLCNSISNLWPTL